MIALKFVEVHTPLFFAKKNHGLKLNDGAQGLTLGYDAKTDKVHVWYGGERTILGSYANIVPWSNGDLVGEAPTRPTTSKPEPSAAPRGEVLKGKVKAQVGGPQDHVFAGPGNGLARDPK